MKKILVTGSNGFIGKNFIEHYGTKYDIIKCSRNAIDFAKDDPYFIKDEFNRMFNYEPITAVHLAAKATTKDPCFMNNVAAMHKLIDCLPQGSRIILASSVVVSDFFNENLGVKETDYPNPRSEYAASKLACETLLQTARNCGKIFGVALRFCAVAGKHSTHGLIHDIIRKLKSDSPTLELLGDAPGSVKPYLYIGDAVRMIDQCVKTNYLDHVFEHSIVNVAPDDNISVEDVANIVMKVTGINKPIQFLGASANWSGDNPFIKVNNFRLTNKRRGNFTLDYPNSSLAVEQAIKDIVL